MGGSFIRGEMKQKSLLLITGLLILVISGCVNLTQANNTGNQEEKNGSVSNAGDDMEPAPSLEDKEMLRLSGTINKVYKFKGTLSEYSYFIITVDKEEIIIFNHKKRSQGFDDYIEKEVTLLGRNITGFLGWKKEPADGVLVLDISESIMENN
jgi:hypothetical protein